MKTYAEKLQELIDENKLNYSKLEENLRDDKGYTTITRQTISNYCKGSDPELSKLKILAKYFNVSPIYFIDDEIENKTNKTVDIGKELNLSDKVIEKIKNINKEETIFPNGHEFHSYRDNNIKIFNTLLEEFEDLQDFLRDFDTLSCHLEIYEMLYNISFVNQLNTYFIDLYYNDKEKLKHILTYMDNKINGVIKLLQDGTRCSFEYNRDEFDCLVEYKNDLIYRLNQKKMTKNSKDEIFIDTNEIIEICLETMGELKKEIIYNRYELNNYISSFINNYKNIELYKKIKQYGDVYLSDDEELNKFIIEGNKRRDKYTTSELKKYSIFGLQH